VLLTQEKDSATVKKEGSKSQGRCDEGRRAGLQGTGKLNQKGERGPLKGFAGSKTRNSLILEERGRARKGGLKGIRES